MRKPKRPSGWQKEIERKQLYDWVLSVLLDENTNFSLKAEIFSDVLLYERHRSVKPKPPKKGERK